MSAIQWIENNNIDYELISKTIGKERISTIDLVNKYNLNCNAEITVDILNYIMNNIRMFPNTFSVVGSYDFDENTNEWYSNRMVDSNHKREIKRLTGENIKLKQILESYKFR